MSLPVKVLARRESSLPMDTHFWKKYKEKSLNLLISLDGQFSMSAQKPAAVRGGFVRRYM